MIKREKNEAKVCNDLILIYPLISYENQFKIEDTFNMHYQKLKQEIENKKKEQIDR
jgi:hypothetical protein